MANTDATYELARLKRELKPFRLHWFPTLGSTNSHAARMRREGRLFAPSVILTGRQTSGRGRGTNIWHSTRGVMTVTGLRKPRSTGPISSNPLILLTSW